MNNSILIVGAGAAGLLAAKELSAKQYKVIILEADKRCGGRIHTLHDAGFIKPVEAGAEFIHGNQKITLQLLDEAGISYHATTGKMLRSENGEWKKQDDFTEAWDELMPRMHQLKKDTTLADFLNKYFIGEKYNSLRLSVQNFAEGFDLADINTAGVFALRDEWSHEEGPQYRIDGGYQQLINNLSETCIANGCSIQTSCVVKEVFWKKNEVRIVTADDKIFIAAIVIITVPVSVLQAEPNHEAAIRFIPSIDQFFKASKMIGYGTVIKILLQFDEAFWPKNAGFILSNENVPAWWTQSPDSYPLLTGWLNGSKAKTLRNTDEAGILEESLRSLSAIFKIDIPSLEKKLTAWKIIDWSANPFSLGGYSFSLPETPNAKKLMNIPIEQTIFFAGEGLYDGDAPGTVEAALVSGREVAKKIIAQGLPTF